MKITFSQNKAKVQIDLSEKALIESSGAMKRFLNAYSELCTEIKNSDMAKNSIDKPLFNDGLLDVRIQPK